MSLFQCEHCGCVENTALSAQGFKMMAHLFDWTGIEDRNGKRVCSACGPTHFRSGKRAEEFGQWHGVFKRTFLPMGMFKTNCVGNLEHIETGSENYRQYEIEPSSPDHRSGDPINQQPAGQDIK